MASFRIASAIVFATAQLISADTTPKTVYEIHKWANITGTKVNDDMKNKYFSIADGMDTQLNCMTNEQIPTAPRSLSFCHKFNDNACCVPQLDDENNDFFGQLTNLGLSCRLRGDIREDALAKFYCMNCDPDQPKYIRIGLSIDDLMDDYGGRYTSDGGVRGVHTADFVGDDGKQIVLVSLQWAIKEFGGDPLLAGRDNRLAKCGLLVSVPCAGDTVQELDGRDRYMCGDDLFLPANSGYEVIVQDELGNYMVNESLFQFLNYPSLGTPMIDDGFHFWLVDETTCETDSTSVTTSPSAYINARCPRTAEQIKSVKINELQNKMTYRDWVCANLQEDGFDGSSDATFNASVFEFAGFCEDTCTEKLLTDCNDGDANQCALYAKQLVESPKKRCCCGHWNDERVFSSAIGVTPLMSTIVFLLAFVAMLHA